MRHAVILCLMLGATPVQAGAWEEFEARCLVPMENIELAQPTDLTADKNFKNDGDTYSTYAFEAFTLAISDGRAAQSQWCYVTIAASAGTELIARAQTWRGTHAGSDRYQVIEDTGSGFHMQSLEWREPRIDVTLSRGGDDDLVTLRVEETDLES